MLARIRAKAFIRRHRNPVYGICSFIFRTLEVFLRRLEVFLPRYRAKHLFVGFEIGFTAFASLFLEHWRLFYVD